MLSAIEGLEVYTSEFRPYTVPLAVVILIGLFAASRFGPDRIGSVLGGFMVGLVRGVGGAGDPATSTSIRRCSGRSTRCTRPVYSGSTAATRSGCSGSVVLCITGGEALFADRGHFGRKPIAVAWMGLIYPALILNYFGQGARLLDAAPIPENNLFYALVPGWALLPMVFLATTATIIASIALIFGAFSLTQQAIALGVFPRLNIVHTNREHEGPDLHAGGELGAAGGLLDAWRWCSVPAAIWRRRTGLR